MHPAKGLQFTARVGELPEDVFSVIGFELTEGLSELVRGRLKMASNLPTLAAADALEQRLELTIWQNGAAIRRFIGVVSEFVRGDSGHRRTHYEVVIQPPLWRLGLRHNSRIFQSQSADDILSTLVRERGMNDAMFDLQHTPPEREYCVQHRESDLAFFERLAAEEGWHFRYQDGRYQHGRYHHGSDDGQEHPALILADNHRNAPRLEAVEYDTKAGGSSRQPAVFRLRYEQRVRAAAVVMKDYTFHNPAYGLTQEHAASSLQHRNDYQHYEYPGRFKADASGKQFTRARLDALRNDAGIASGDSNRADFTCGAKVQLTRHTNEKLNQDWLITHVAHSGSQPQALEEEAGTKPTTYHNRFSAVPGNINWRPRCTHRPLMDGPQIAIVTGPEGEEIHCDQHGRVQVRFPWDQRLRTGQAESSESSGEQSSAWLRVSQGWAGGQYGFVALPRVGHEVIVSFLDGDPDQPIITGRTYHATNTPPYALPQHKTRTTLKTQTHKGEGSNELRFEDEADKEHIYIHAQKNLDLLTQNNRTEVIKNNSHLTVGNDRFSHVKANDHATVDGEHREKIGGDYSLTVNGSHHSKFGKAQLVEAGNEIHHKAGMKIVIEAGAEVTLKAGGSFVKVDPSGVTISGPLVRMNSGGGPGSGTAAAVKAPDLPQAMTAAGEKTAPGGLANVEQRADAAPRAANATGFAASAATVKATLAPGKTALKEAASAGSLTVSDCEFDEGGRCKLHQHDSSNVSQSTVKTNTTSTTASRSAGSNEDTEDHAEPGFHVVREVMSKNALLQSLYGDTSAKPGQFDRLNPNIGDQVMPGEMIILGDPNGMECTQEEADLMQVASQVNERVQALDEEEAQFLIDHYDLLETLTSSASAGVGAGSVMIANQIKSIEITLRDLEALHQDSYKKRGHLNSSEFFEKRRGLFKRLNFSLGKIARKGMSLGDNPKLKTALGLSSQSIVHNWKQSGVGNIPGYATHYDKLATGAKYAKFGGYLAIGLDIAVTEMRIKEACITGTDQECTKVKYSQRGRVIGSTAGGTLGATAGLAGCAAVGLTTAGIGGVACAIIVGGAGSVAGGIGGGSAGESGGEIIYEGIYRD
jgi:type VI secretion system secreted protein VgrG